MQTPVDAPLHKPAEAIKDDQVTYHDWESGHYDDKWSISFDQRCIDYAEGRFRRVVPHATRYDRVLEVGCGTGFFLLNLAQAGLVGEAHCTDISPGMVEACVANGRRLGITVAGEVADAEALPYPDAAFDLVVGHAVVHHLPDLETCFSELARVLVPGGRLVIAGEPTVVGDRIAAHFKRAGRMTVKLAGVVAGRERVLRAGVAEMPEAERRAASLEWEVDLHIFSPTQLEDLARGAGFVDVVTVTEELTANWFGWWTRTVEAMLRPELIPTRYKWFAYRTWQWLFALDEAVRPMVPKAAYYNTVLTGTVRAAAGSPTVTGSVT